MRYQNNFIQALARAAAPAFSQQKVEKSFQAVSMSEIKNLIENDEVRQYREEIDRDSPQHIEGRVNGLTVI